MQDEDQLFNKLLAEYTTQTISAQNKEHLFQMILKTKAYKEQYEEVVQLSTLLHLPYFISNKEKDYLSIINKTHAKKKEKKIVWHSLFIRVVAAVAILAVVSLGSIFLYKTTIIGLEDSYSFIEASTPLGGQTRLLLPDGSIAWLNAKSELKYGKGFGKTDRQLYLEGEGYFEVYENDQLPFSVCSDEMEVIATGTIFNIRSYQEDEKWEVNLLEGGVNVLISNQPYSLRANEKVVYDKASASVSVEPSESYRAALWTKGKLSFHQASIPEIYKMLERHFNVQLQIASEELKKEYFLGSINLEMSLSEILIYLDVDRKYRIEINKDTIVVKDK